MAMFCLNLLNSLFYFIILCLNFIAESFTRSNFNGYECSASSGVSELPPSVILEILLKLPIKSIFRCTSVCKSWQNLISDPYFANIYLKNPPFTAIALSQQRTLSGPLYCETFYILEIGRNGDVMRTPFNPKVINISRTRVCGIMGSCNGLLCLVQSPLLERENLGNYYNRDSIYNNQTLYVINPVTGERIVLPEVQGAEHISDVIFGFGSGGDDARYKVLRIVIRYIGQGYEREIKVDGKIFTIGVDKKWRDIKDSSIPHNLFPCGVILNGVLHWVGNDTHSSHIYAFHIEEERGRRIPLPLRLGEAPCDIELAIWNGHLCLTDNSDERQVDIWTMREYGVRESWTRDIVVRNSIPSTLCYYSFFPVTTMRNGDLLMSSSYGERLVAFDPKIKNCTKLEVCNVEGTVSFMFDFVPSFLSLKTIL